jgi:hypothetical protein
VPEDDDTGLAATPQTLKVPPRPGADIGGMVGGGMGDNLPVTNLPGFQIPGVNMPTGTSAIMEALRPILGQSQPTALPQAQGRPAMPGMPQAQPQSPMAQLTKHILPQPPTPKYRDPLETLANPLTSLALIGSLFTRTPATTAMKALGGAMKAQAEGDQVRYANEYQKYQQELNKVHTETQEELAEYKMIYENRRLSLAERTARMRGVATRRGDSAMNAVLDGGGDPGPLLGGRQSAVSPITAAKAKAQRIAEIRTDANKNGTPISYVDAEARYKQEQQEAKDRTLTETGSSEDPSLHGEDYLATLPPSTADYLRAMGRGDLPIPPGRSDRDKAVLKMLAKAYPDIRGQTYAGRLAAERSYASGDVRKAIRAANTLIGHLGQLDENIDYLDTTSFRTANRAILAWAKETGDPTIAPVLDDLHAVAEELGRVLKGTVTEGEIHRTMALLDASQSIPVLRAHVREFIHLMNTRMDVIESEIQQTTGRSSDNAKVLNPKAQETVKKIQGGGGAPAVGAVEQGYRFKGGDRYDQNNWERVE